LLPSGEFSSRMSEFRYIAEDLSLIRYLNYLSVMKKTEESLRRLKKGKKAGFSLFGSSSTPADDGKDEERIRHQMALDVEAFGEDAIALGVNVEECQAYVQLGESVRVAWIEETQ
jgi:hypothetical protein